jgi:hypothetical protein
MPLWLVLLLMTGASYRLTRLITKDDFPPVLWVRDRLAGGWRPPTTKEQHHAKYPVGQLAEGSCSHVPGLGMFTLSDGEIQIYARKAGWSPYWLADLISCPWCASAYVSLSLTLAEYWWGGTDLPGTVWLFIWLGVWAVSAQWASREWA